MLRVEVLETRDTLSGSGDVPAIDILDGVPTTGPVTALIGDAAGSIAAGAVEQQPAIAPPADPFVGPPWVPGPKVP